MDNKEKEDVNKISDDIIKVNTTLNVNVSKVEISGNHVKIYVDWNFPPASNAYSKWDYGIK